MGAPITNIFDIFRPQIPELVERVTSDDGPGGNLCNNERHVLMAPTSMNGETPPEELYLDITINKQRPGVYFASINNVTDQVRMQRESFISAQHLKAIMSRVDGYAILTLDGEGKISGCNNSDAAPADEKLLGKVWFDALALTEEKAAELMQACQQQGWLGFHLAKPTKDEGQLWGDIMLMVISDAEGGAVGYSLMIRNTEA